MRVSPKNEVCCRATITEDLGIPKKDYQQEIIKRYKFLSACGFPFSGVNFLDFKDPYSDWRYFSFLYQHAGGEPDERERHSSMCEMGDHLPLPNFRKLLDYYSFAIASSVSHMAFTNDSSIHDSAASSEGGMGWRLWIIL